MPQLIGIGVLSARRHHPRDHRRARERGIALMVVFITFVILILVVTQLQYTTKLEEELSEVRATEWLGASAIPSVAAHVLTLLAEDFRESRMSAGGAGAGAAPGAELPPMTGQEGGGGGGDGGGGDGGGRGGGGRAGQTPTPGAGGAAGGAGATGSGDPGTYDYLLKRIFSPDTKTINGVSVKYIIRDNERAYDLNRLWDYPRVITETIMEEQELETREEAAEGDADAEGDEDPGGGRVDPGALLRDLEAAAGEEVGLNVAPITWIEPTEEQRELVREMITRAIDLTITLNEERGFFYRFALPNPSQTAFAIEDYCYMRRSQTYQNSINLVSEILNIDGMPPELFYGPMPEIPRGEEYFDPQQFYSYRKDEFGDLVGEALYPSDEWLFDQEERRADFEYLMSTAEGPFQQFAGLGALGNPLTRSMPEYPEDIDGLGLLVPPQPIGLRDIFCTHSAGKININTVSPPVLYGLLLSLPEEEAMKVALDVEQYRYLYQEEMSEEEMAGEVGGVQDSRMPDLGQPRREPPLEEELDPTTGEFDQFSGTVGLENPETNYFTDLRQLVLIDGEEGDENDLLNEREGVEVISEEFRTPFQNVRDDLQKVAVFGGTYFTVVLKIKTEKSPVVKEGTLLVHRDVEQRRIEIIQWKELER